MEYHEVQNEYQAYWSIIKDDEQPKPLIAICMRNIVEYFFAFISNKELKYLFNENEFRDDNKFQAFYRYINREAHSDGSNLSYFKEFNFNDFKYGFEKLFNETGHTNHYEKMMGD